MKRTLEGDHHDPDPSLTEIKNAVSTLYVSLFRDPLEARGANLSVLQDKTEDAFDYTRSYLELESTTYRKARHYIHISPTVLIGITYCFCVD